MVVAGFSLCCARPHLQMRPGRGLAGRIGRPSSTLILISNRAVFIDDDILALPECAVSIGAPIWHNAPMAEEHDTPEQMDVIGTGRLEAFSDGVMAVIITIMVLELRPPPGAELKDLISLVPKLLVYMLSFVFIGIYWNNHHHLLRATPGISGGVMWANLHLLFWLSLVPVSTAWAGDHLDAPWPAVIYGAIALLTAIAYYILERFIIRANKGADIERAIGADHKDKISLAIYAFGMLLAGFGQLAPAGSILTYLPIVSYLTYAVVAVIWFIPDRRFTRQ